MNAYEAKQAARKERMAERAERLSLEAGRLHAEAHRMASLIPFGQPILVGHHSESRDRNYRGRIHDKFGKAFALWAKAEECERRAISEGGAISSDDEDAADKLRAKVAKLEAHQERMRAANKLVRRKDVAGLAALVGEAAAHKLMQPDCCGRLGFPDYALKNNNANIRRIRERIAGLEAHQGTTAAEPVRGNGFEIREDIEDNRIAVSFDAKPSREVCELMKRHGFKWSPSRCAWVRMLNGAGRYAAQCVAEALARE